MDLNLIRILLLVFTLFAFTNGLQYAFFMMNTNAIRKESLKKGFSPEELQLNENLGENIRYFLLVKKRGFSGESLVVRFDLSQVNDNGGFEEYSEDIKWKVKLYNKMRTACVPKLICEMNASPQKVLVERDERNLLDLLGLNSVTSSIEVPTAHHFAAHMGQLIAGIEGNGCHNFYPDCPVPIMKIERNIISLQGYQI